MGDMSNDRMIELMGMDDDAAHSMLLFDQLEWGRSDGDDALNWEAQAWFGDDYNKAWFESEGEYDDGDAESRNELLWDRIITRWWNLQAGVRHDLSEGPSRTWAALSVQGLAPQWFEVDAAIYVGEQQYAVAAVGLVGDDGVADVLHVDAQLVRPARLPERPRHRSSSPR